MWVRFLYLLGPFILPPSRHSERWFPQQMWQNGLVSVHHFWGVISGNDDAYFPVLLLFLKTSWLSLCRKAAVGTWPVAIQVGVAGWAEAGLLQALTGSSDTGDKQPEWHLTGWFSVIDACQLPNSQTWWWLGGPNVWEFSIVAEVSRAGPLTTIQWASPELRWWPVTECGPLKPSGGSSPPWLSWRPRTLRELRCFQSPWVSLGWKADFCQMASLLPKQELSSLHKNNFVKYILFFVFKFL